MLRALSAFSGAGGLDIGLEAAGFELLGILEVDRHASDTLRRNRPQWRHLEPSDVEAYAAGNVLADLGLRQGDLDLLAGGPPCQPFSRAAEWAPSGRAGLGDARRSGISGFFGLALKLWPKVILIENVPGFVQGDTSAVPFLKAMTRQLTRRSGIPYALRLGIVDSADYGVPQHRRRAIVMLFRSDLHLDLPIGTHSYDPITAWDALGDLTAPEDPPRPSGKWTYLLPSIPEGSNYLWHTRRGGGSPIFGYRTRFWSFLLKLDRNRPSWTIPASPGPATGPFHWDNRPLTVQECLRLQSFPDSWELSGPQRTQYRQAGNATPPVLAEAIARRIADALGAPPAGRSGLTRYHSILEQPVLRSEALRTRGLDAVSDHAGEGRGPAPRHDLTRRIYRRGLVDAEAPQR